jgi:hypothetical protein
MEGTTSRVRTTETSKVSVGGAAAQTAEATMKTAQAGPSGMRSGAPRTPREEAYRVPQPLMRQLVKAALQACGYDVLEEDGRRRM